MTIGHLISSLVIAGIQRFVVSLAQQQVAEGHRVVVFVLASDVDPSLEAELRQHNVPVVSLNKTRQTDPRVMPRLGRLLRQHGVDVLHTHGYPLVYGLPPSVWLGVPIVHTLHALMPIEVARGVAPFIHTACRLRVPFVAISAAVAASFHDRFGAHARVIDSGVDLPRFAAPVDRDAVRAQYNIPADAHVIITVARVETVKGVDLALEAFAQMADAHPKAHWVMVGVGGYLSELQRRIPATLANRVHLTGLIANVVPLLRAADVFLLTSRSEGLGLAAIEGLAAGLPCVVFPVGGLVEVVQHEHNGLIAAQATPAHAAQALDRLLSDASLMATCRSHAVESVERFSLAHASQCYTQAYQTAQTSRTRRWIRRIHALGRR